MRLDHLLSKENRVRIQDSKLKTPVQIQEGLMDAQRKLVIALFNFEGTAKSGSLKENQPARPTTWGCSSAGRAPALQAGGQGFDSPHLHQEKGP